jgi:hypothetical protein
MKNFLNLVVSSSLYGESSLAGCFFLADAIVAFNLEITLRCMMVGLSVIGENDCVFVACGERAGND